MTESDTQKLHEFMEKLKSKAPVPPKTLLTKSGLIEYRKSDEFKQRLKKAQEECRRKNNP